jgi:hypothetical protein
MQSYNEIQGFEYWNTEAWKHFIENHILPLHHLTSTLLNLRNFILKIIEKSGGATLSEVVRERSELLQFMLGGIKEDGEYKENSLAKLVKLTLGIYVNPKQWVTLEMEEGLRASDYVDVKIEDTQFLEFLNKLNEITLRIAKLVGVEPKEVLEGEIEEILQKPEKLLETIKAIYVECLQVSANHNYYTFFALSTKTLPFRYMITAYPKLKANFNQLKEFLGLKKTFEPNVAEEKVREDYTIWGHLENGLCDSLYKLNDTIWKYLLNENVKSVLSYITTSFKNLKQEYAQKVQQKLNEIKWEFPRYINASYENDSYIYTISGPILIKKSYSHYYPSTGEFYHRDEECNISLLKLFDDLSPILFLGSLLDSYFLLELKISNNTLEILRIWK